MNVDDSVWKSHADECEWCKGWFGELARGNGDRGGISRDYQWNHGNNSDKSYPTKMAQKKKERGGKQTGD